MYRLRLFLILCLLFIGHVLFPNNIRVGTVQWNPRDIIQGKTVISLTFTVSWDNSWRDDYNWDAAYIFLKYRLKTGGTNTWHHLYINGGSCSDNNLNCELAPGAPNSKGVGVFIYRRSSGNGPINSSVEVQWELAGNDKEPVDRTDFSASTVQIVASAMEMVWVPRGPFRVGDSYSHNGFWRDYIPFPSSGDLIDASSNLYTTSGNAYAAADHVGGSASDTTSCWIPDAGTKAEWYVDFSKTGRQMIRYFGFCGAKGSTIPSKWHLEATNNMNYAWDTLYAGNSSDWVEAFNTAYPPEHTFAIPTNKLKKAYTYYRFVIPEVSGVVAIKSISMTAGDIPLARDHSVLIDGETVLLDRQRHLGAQDGDSWTGGSTPVGYPTGYKEYYAMKYELSQEQYVDFLNRLSLPQQQALLPHVNNLSEGDYLFGNPTSPTCRNGIILARKASGEAMVFACNLNPLNAAGSADDGQTLACNYLNIKDLLAYASWSGLRPLSELEYEKLGRPLYTYEDLPLEGEYAWNTQILKEPSNLSNSGKREETCNGNANYGGIVQGPLRCGIFAQSDGKNREASGAGYWGCFDLSGNLQELYYNTNAGGRQFRGVGFENHGNGYISDNSQPIPTGWPSAINAFALRGGSFASENTGELAISDRHYFAGGLSSNIERDSSTGFRLGRNCPSYEMSVTNTLRTSSGRISDGENIAVDTVIDGASFSITGSGAAEVGAVYTVLWYKNEDNSAEWSLMDGFTDKNLSLHNVVGKYGQGNRMREYRYRRRLIVPTGESEAEVILRVVDPTYSIDRRKATLVYGSNSHGITVTSRNTGLQVTWRDLKSNSELPVTTKTETSSYYRARCEDFPEIILGEERAIEISGSIHERSFFKDTVTYVIPAPEFTFDKREVTINYNGTAGITMKTNHLVNVTWVDTKSGKVLLTSSNVTSSYCHPQWNEFTDTEINERRTIRVDIISVDGCYSRTEEVVMIIPPCMQTNPFASQPVQTFANTSGGTNVLNVQCDWDSSVPKIWGVQGSVGGISINSSTGQLSNLSGTICNITVTLADQRCPDRVYTKQVKETYRNYTYTGSLQSVTLSSGNYQFECWGARGGSSSEASYTNSTHGGYGGHAYGNITLNQSKVAYIYVGGAGGLHTGGWNGGGTGSTYGGGGGGGSDIRLNGTAYSNRVIVAGGGGGASGGSHPANGGEGGGSSGTRINSTYGTGAAPGTQTSGYALGTGQTVASYHYAGGGGGYYGGYAGYAVPGGGGSGYIGGVTGGNMETGVRNGSGLVKITVK